jgi:SET domain-containing protein|tara:strand:- start:6376 stop:6771 length:396 start_codon:yes stop_codon:yes gene_type:complete
VKSLVQHKGLEIKKSPIHGYGVFTTQDIPNLTLIEECHLILFHNNDALRYNDINLIRNGFGWPKLQNSSHIAIPFGYGCIYNSSDDPNINWKTNEEKFLLEFYTIRDIKKGEELCHYYGNLIEFCRKNNIL